MCEQWQLWVMMILAISLFSSFGDTEECEDEVSLLQHLGARSSSDARIGNSKRVSAPSGKSGLANLSNHSSIGTCPSAYKESFQYTQELQERPIKDVLQNHSGVDGFCLARSIHDYWKSCSDARLMGDYDIFGKSRDRIWEAILAQNREPIAIPLDGIRIITKDRGHAMDDVICTANGFYDIPRERAINDFDYVSAMSDKHCKWLSEQIPDFDNITMDWLNIEERKDDLAVASLWRGNPSTDDKMRLKNLKFNALKHEAVKCLLGGVGCDINFCARRGCIGADGVVKYGLDATC